MTKNHEISGDPTPAGDYLRRAKRDAAIRGLRRSDTLDPSMQGSTRGPLDSESTDPFVQGRSNKRGGDSRR